MLQIFWFFEKIKYLCYYEYHRRRLLINKGKNMISVNDFKTGLTLELDNG